MMDTEHEMDALDAMRDAAPDMLETLKNVQANLTGRDCLAERITDSLRRIEAAIAKAEGREG